MLYAVLVHHILAAGMQNNRQALLPRAGVLPELIPHDLVHSLSAEGPIDLPRRNGPCRRRRRRSAACSPGSA